jgi:hypothetical protein
MNLYADVSEHCSIFIGLVNKNNKWDEFARVFIQDKRKEKGPEWRGGGCPGRGTGRGGQRTRKWRPAVRQVGKGTRKWSQGMVVILFTRPMKMEQSVPKRQHTKFRRRGNYPKARTQHPKTQFH